MTAFWQMPYEPDPEDPALLEVTGFGDPVRSFIPSYGLAQFIRPARDLSWAAELEDLAEFRRAWLMAGPPVTSGRITAGPPLTGTPAPEIIPPVTAARRRGQCQGCGTDDGVDIWSRCAYCAELAVLKARNLPGPRLSGWWFMVPVALAVSLLTALVYAVAAVILAA